MKAISRRLAKLETVFAPVTKSEDMWGSMAELGDDLLRQAEERGEPSVAELREQLEQLGPTGLWREAARGYLSDHGSSRAEMKALPKRWRAHSGLARTS